MLGGIMLEKFKNRQWIVVGMDHYSPLGTIRSLGELGISPVYISVKNKARVATKSKYISRVHKVDTPAEAYQVLKDNYWDINPVPILIISDDSTMQYIDNHYTECKDHFLTFNAGRDGRITEFMNKINILDVASRHGIPTLNTIVVDNGDIEACANLEYPIITKSISPNVGGWKSDVHICENEEELREAFKTIKSPKVLIQRFIDKKNERCLDGYTYNGGKDIFISIDSHYLYNIKGYYSPYHDVNGYNMNQDLTEKLRSMFEEIGFEGIFSLEFIIDKDGTEYFTEVNFRQSTWSRCSAMCGMNLSLMWAYSMETGQYPTQYITEIPEGFKAMTEPIDYAKRVLTGDISLFEWLADFKGADCTYYYDKDDLEPYYDMVDHLEVLM